MGLCNCKSLCSKSKPSESLNNGGFTAQSSGIETVARPQPAKASDFNVSTIQNAVTQEGSLRSAIAKSIEFESIEEFVEDDDDFIEKNVCNASEIEENEMREVDFDNDKKILLIKQRGRISAIGAKCTHDEAPLVDGALGEGRIRCPWHGACFNITTGDIEDFPGLDSLPCYQVKIVKGVVKVRAKKFDLGIDRRIKPMAMKDSRNGEIYAIVGGGPAAQTCVETLRQSGFVGRIVMICKEPYLPYDRVRLSKYLDAEVEDLQLRPKEFYDENQIEVSLGVEATALDTTLKEISLSSGNKLKYDKLFIATGTRSRLPNLPGSNLKNIFTLRTLDDSQKLNQTLTKSSRVVIQGSSFIAMETAAYCVDKVAQVTVVGRGSAPLSDLLGEAIGTQIMELFKSKNVEFIMNSGVKNFLSNGDTIERVELINGRILLADICIAGIGSELNTDFLRKSGLIINDDGSIDTSLHLSTNIDDIFVGGDIANAPVYCNNNELATISHYGLAQYHGKIAGLNMAGIKTELRTVPYFFTFLFDKCFTYTGHGKASEIFIEGDLAAFKFVAVYFDKGENVIAMSSCQPDRSIAEFAEKLAQGCKYHKSDIEWVTEAEQEN